MIRKLLAAASVAAVLLVAADAGGRQGAGLDALQDGLAGDAECGRGLGD